MDSEEEIENAIVYYSQTSLLKDDGTDRQVGV